MRAALPLVSILLGCGILSSCCGSGISTGSEPKVALLVTTSGSGGGLWFAVIDLVTRLLEAP